MWKTAMNGGMQLSLSRKASEIYFLEHASKRTTKASCILCNWQLQRRHKCTTCYMDNCVLHFQNNHKICPDDSECKSNDMYAPEWVLLKDPVAVQLLTDIIHSLTLYKNAEDYVENRDTYYVGSFNNSCLTALDKRLLYKDETYRRRITLRF